uniref:GAGA-binding transcriptional activator n=1 Tax=Macrostomum lignano TaxID=282301 RepID=A0A1I8FSI3_9PLAT
SQQMVSRAGHPRRVQQPGTECGPVWLMRRLYRPVSNTSTDHYGNSSANSAIAISGSSGAFLARRRRQRAAVPELLLKLPRPPQHGHSRRQMPDKRAQPKRRRSNRRSLNRAALSQRRPPPLRQILYPDRENPNHNRPDYRFEPPPYLAVDRNIGPQACPSCQQQALSQALVSLA